MNKFDIVNQLLIREGALNPYKISKLNIFDNKNYEIN